jgi:diguanylate cyclase
MTRSGTTVLGWRLALGFTLLTGICALAIGFYMANARQHVGSDYTSLVADIARAQQDPVQLRRKLDRLQAAPDALSLEQLDTLLWRISVRMAGIRHSLEQSRLPAAAYAEPLEAFEHIATHLPTLKEQLDRASHDSEALAALEQQAWEVEETLAWAYSELNEQVHSVSADQRRIMERLSLAVGVLVLLVLLVVGALMLALLRLSRERETVARLSREDELTGLANRRLLLEAADALHQQSLRNGRSLSLALLDLDHFKRLNDSFGHPAGDRVLKTFADTLKSETRQADIVARIGGEEFCVLMPDTPDGGARELAERIRQRVAALPRHTLGVPSSLTVSVGLATGQGPDSRFESLYARADRALYRAKARGRNTVEVS